MWHALRSGSWYDRVFVAPLATAALGVVGPLITPKLGMTANWDIPIFASLAFLVLLNGGPARRDWQLTAPCRMVPPLFEGAGLSRI